MKAEFYRDAVLARLGEKVVQFAERLDGKWACRFEEHLEDARPVAPDKRIGTPCTAHTISPPLPVRPPGEAGTLPGPDRFLAELGERLMSDGLPLAGGALTLAVPHPIVVRRTRLWRAETGVVIEALGFADGMLSQAGSDWLAGLGPVQQDTVGLTPDSPVLGEYMCQGCD